MHFGTSYYKNVNGKKHYKAMCKTKDVPSDKITFSLKPLTCPECILALMTEYEHRICTLEEMYETLYPNRPLGDKLQ